VQPAWSSIYVQRTVASMRPSSPSISWAPPPSRCGSCPTAMAWSPCRRTARKSTEQLFVVVPGGRSVKLAPRIRALPL